MTAFAIAFMLLCDLTAVARAAEPPQAGAAPPAAGTATAVPSSAASPAQPSATAPAATSAPAADAAAKPVAAAEPAKVICRNEKVTGSKLRSRKVCSSSDSESKSGDWVREQQARGAIGASAILNGQ